MMRRQFITLLGGATAAWPLAARAQQSAMPVIGFLHAGAPEANANNVQAFRKGLGETGHVEGGNVSIDFQWAYGDLARRSWRPNWCDGRWLSLSLRSAPPRPLPPRRRRRPFRSSFPQAPIRCRSDWCRAFNRPAGNLTGVNYMQSELGAKRLGLLHEMVPLASRIALLVNPTNSVATEATIKDVGTAA